MLELFLRTQGVADAEVYEPPRLVSVVNDGAIAGEFEFRFGAHFETFEEGGEAWIRTAADYRLSPGAGYPGNGGMRDIRFTAEPPEGVRRFVLLGGSAALGQAPSRSGPQDWTATDLPGGPGALDLSQTISGQLEAQLSQAGVNAEVINAGMIAQDSGSVRSIASEVMDYGPEGLLLYMGNNEGIALAYAMNGADLPVIVEVRGWMRSLATYRWLADRLSPRIRSTRRLDPGRDGERIEYENRVLAEVVQTQWASAGAPLDEDSLPTDTPYLALQERFRSNLTHIVEEATRRGVKVYVIPTPPHLTHPPFSTSHDPRVATGTRKSIERTLVAGHLSLGNQAADDTLAKAETALDQDRVHAPSLHLQGLALGALDRREEALSALEQALLWDISRKRTLPAYGRIAREVCAAQGCTAGDAHLDLLERVQEVGLSEYDRMLGDHEHLNPEGNAWVASLFAALILED